jgi:Anti-sigma-28 factor, FlgM
MQTHLPCPYKGPVTSDRNWWPRSPQELLGDAVPALDDPQIRADLVRRIRAEIAAGTYDTPEKWEAALDKLWKRLGEQ